jgi:hypothetical protein
MSLPVVSAAYRVPTGLGVDHAVRARPVEPVSRVEPTLRWPRRSDATSTPSWGPAAQLALTPLGEVMLRTMPRRLLIDEARLERVRRLIAAEGYTPAAVERAARVLTLA